jgi:hypothetical protein
MVKPLSKLEQEVAGLWSALEATEADNKRLRAALRGARRYVADARSDEDPETQRHSTALVNDIDRTLAQLARRHPMTDIIERLRHRYPQLEIDTDRMSAGWEAAAEIERLRGMVRAQAALLTITQDALGDRYQEIEQLRKPD